MAKPKILQDLENNSNKIEILSQDVEVLNDEINQAKVNPLTLQRGENIIHAKRKTPLNMVELNGRTVVNHVPLFDSGLWVLDTITTVVNSSTVEVTSDTTNMSINYISISVKPNTEYTVMSPEYTGYIGIFNNNGRSEGLINGGWNSKTPVTFNTGNHSVIRIYISNYNKIGTFTFKNITLTEGTEPQPFVANVKGITNPTIENKTNGSSVTLLGTFHEGDRVYVEDGQYFVERNKREVVLDGSEEWEYHSSKENFKTVTIPTWLNNHNHYGNNNFVKFNGKLLEYTISALNLLIEDVGYMNTSGTVTLAISNTDSGWGDDYTPTPEEIKAYFMGWKMYEGSNALSAYNGIGTKAWTPLQSFNGSTYVGYRTELPTEPPNQSNTSGWRVSRDWQPYRLIYDLATPATEPIEAIGNVTLEAGENVVEVTEGRVVRERANPVPNAQGTGFHIAYVETDTVLGGSAFINRPDKIIRIYKNGTDDTNNWTIWTAGVEGSANYFQGNQRAFISDENFDPTAIYTVDYIPLEPYKLTAPIESLEAEHYERLASVVGETVEELANVEKRVDVVEREMVRKDAPVEWIEPTLLNGWENYGSGVIGASFYKDDLGIVHLRGLIRSGDKARGTIMFYLPIGFRPKSNTHISTISNDENNIRTFSGILIKSNGQVTVEDGSNVWFSLNNISFKAEQ